MSATRRDAFFDPRYTDFGRPSQALPQRLNTPPLGYDGSDPPVKVSRLRRILETIFYILPERV